VDVVRAQVCQPAREKVRGRRGMSQKTPGDAPPVVAGGARVFFHPALNALVFLRELIRFASKKFYRSRPCSGASTVHFADARHAGPAKVKTRDRRGAPFRSPYALSVSQTFSYCHQLR
jgi:hypothetical protein